MSTLVDDGPRLNSAPAKRRSWLLVVLALAIGIAGGGFAVYLVLASREAPVAEGPKQMYQCPMHPTVVRDHPGDCPICGMKLVPMGGQQEASTERKIVFYRSPHDPKKTSPAPKKDEMGMDYTPVYEDELEGSAGPEGLATVKIDPARQQLIGLRTAPVTLGRVGSSWRTVGRVAVDETRVRHINLKVAGFVEALYADFIGKAVKKGDPLFAIYSPELYSAQEELLLALKTQEALARTGGLNANGDDLVAASRRRLELWDVPAAEIERVVETRRSQKSLVFRSPISGVLTKKDVVQGMRLEAGAMPLEITDLSEVWVLADVYESEIRNVKVGMPGELVLKAFPNRVFKGKVVFADPILDPSTRTVKVRLTFQNPTGELRPEMLGEVVLLGEPREALRIPADAMIATGTGWVVFVELGDGKFQPREVKIGERDVEHVEVVEGVALGERVVARANFLIDSESRLKASLSGMSGTSATGAPSAPKTPVSKPSHEGH